MRRHDDDSFAASSAATTLRAEGTRAARPQTSAPAGRKGAARCSGGPGARTHKASGIRSGAGANGYCLFQPEYKQAHKHNTPSSAWAKLTHDQRKTYQAMAAARRREVAGSAMTSVDIKSSTAASSSPLNKVDADGQDLVPADRVADNAATKCVGMVNQLLGTVAIKRRVDDFAYLCRPGVAALYLSEIVDQFFGTRRSRHDVLPGPTQRLREALRGLERVLGEPIKHVDAARVVQGDGAQVCACVVLVWGVIVAAAGQASVGDSGGASRAKPPSAGADSGGSTGSGAGDHAMRDTPDAEQGATRNGGGGGQSTCRYGRACHRADCWFLHPEGRDDVDAPPPAAVEPAAAAEPADHKASKSPAEESCCSICCEAPKNALVDPCGHVATCFECASQLHKDGRACPICRGAIARVIKAFLV